MATTRFQDLRVYRLAEKLADEVWKVVQGWNVLARDTVGKQLIRSADSVGANIAEGCGRRSFQDNRRFIRIARGSLNETQHWLRRAHVRKLLSPEQTARLMGVITHLAPALNAYMKSVGQASESKDK